MSSSGRKIGDLDAATLLRAVAAGLLVGAYGVAVALRFRRVAAAHRELQDLLSEAAGRDARIVITGANSGIGLELAQQFAKHPQVSLLLGCRGEEKRLGRHNNLPLEMLDLDSVHNFAKEAHGFLSSGADGLRLLVNNAGVKAPPEGNTKINVSATWQTNFLAPFLLTELIARLREDSPAQCMKRPLSVVQVTSGKEHESHLDDAILDAAAEGTPGVNEYADSKKALLLWTSVRAQSLAFKGHIYVHAAAPGRIDTRLGLYWVPEWLWLLAKPLRSLLYGTVAEGALRVARLGLEPQATRKFGDYLVRDTSSEDLIVWRMPEKQLAMRLVRWAGQATELEARSINKAVRSSSTSQRSRSPGADQDRWSNSERRSFHNAKASP